MADSQATTLHSAGLMIGARLINLTMGLIAIPVLIRYLGGTGFGAWAVLLALAAGFSLLEIGMPTAIVRFLAVPARDEDWVEARSIFGSVWLILTASFGFGFIATLLLATPYRNLAPIA